MSNGGNEDQPCESLSLFRTHPLFSIPYLKFMNHGIKCI